MRVTIEKEPRRFSLCNSLMRRITKKQAMEIPKRAQTLNQGEFARLIKITRATVRYPDRDVLVLMLGHHVGMRVTEISRITVADVMLANGKLRSEISLREAVTKGCRQRCAYLATKPLVDALEAYLSYRIAHGIGTELDAAKYRGLLPHQPLIYGARGAALSQNTKRRVLESGEQKDYKACDSLLMRTGIKGSSHSGRRTFAGKVLASTGDMEIVAGLLGHASIECSQRYINVIPDTLSAMFADAL
jgi:site-specific recombinase XerD